MPILKTLEEFDGTFYEVKPKLWCIINCQSPLEMRSVKYFILTQHIEYLREEIKYFKSQGLESWDDNPGVYKGEIDRKNKEIKKAEELLLTLK